MCVFALTLNRSFYEPNDISASAHQVSVLILNPRDMLYLVYVVLIVYTHIYIYIGTGTCYLVLFFLPPPLVIFLLCFAGFSRTYGRTYVYAR